jgi:hypothetical protein
MISTAITKLVVGRGVSKTQSAAAYIVSETGRGVGTGAKAVTNASVDTVVSTVTLGASDNVQAWKVMDAERARGYDAAYSVGRVGTEISLGLATGRRNKGDAAHFSNELRPLFRPGRSPFCGTLVSLMEVADNRISFHTAIDTS